MKLNNSPGVLLCVLIYCSLGSWLISCHVGRWPSATLFYNQPGGSALRSGRLLSCHVSCHLAYLFLFGKHWDAVNIAATMFYAFLSISCYDYLLLATWHQLYIIGY